MSDIKSEFDKVKEVSFDDIFNADMSEDPEPDKIQNPISYQKEIKQIQRVLEILLLLDKRQDRISADQKMECLENMEFCTDSIRRFTPAVIRKDDNTPLKALTDTWSDIRKRHIRYKNGSSTSYDGANKEEGNRKRKNSRKTVRHVLRQAVSFEREVNQRY